MSHVALVAPHFLENTLRYVRAFARLDGVKLSVISEDPARALPSDLAGSVGHYQIESVGDPRQLATALQWLKRSRGPVDRLTGALEQLQTPMAEARELADVPGMRPDVARNFRDKDRMKEVLRAAGVPVAASRLVTSARERGWTPVLDMAYQGFGQGLADDAAAVRRFVDAGIDCLVATSFSKSFSLYGERVGALSVVCASAQEAQRVLSQLKVLIRTNYSNPPTHGAKAVSAVLADAGLRQLWEGELAQMRERIHQMRMSLIAKLEAAGVQQDMSFIGTQQGMFSYSGLSAAQMQRLRSEFGIYGVDSGRICVAALNARNIDYVAQAIAKVI